MRLRGLSHVERKEARISGVRYDAVLFDLFSALLDSGSLWSEVAGTAELGASWREESSRVAYSAGRYRPFVDTVQQAARTVGVRPEGATELLQAMGDRLEAWRDAPEVLARLGEHVQIGVVTNCSEELGARVTARLGFEFDTVVTAEAAGAYKPRPEPYLLALETLGVEPARALFVAGSPSDIDGARGVGMDVCWHNRRRLPLGGHAAPLMELGSLEPLVDLVSS